jgi:hypothetical protein
MQGGRWLWALSFAIGCAGSTPAQTSAAPEPAGASSASPSDASASSEPELQPYAGLTEAASAAPYIEPPPVVVRRYHVFATLDARAKQKLTVTSLLNTASDDAEALAPGTEALLEHKPAGANDWVPVADVTVTGVTTRGSRAAGNERQVIELEIRAEHPAASQKGKQGPFTRKGRMRLQIDRQVAAR